MSNGAQTSLVIYLYKVGSRAPDGVGYLVRLLTQAPLRWT